LYEPKRRHFGLRAKIKMWTGSYQDSCYGADIGANIGGNFFGGISPSKMGRFAPFLATIQAISKTCVFLFNKSWGSTPARVKASKRGAKLYPRGDY
jgi:hypothetical protein